jgi:pyridoxamine 5'-phosphate oxidase
MVLLKGHDARGFAFYTNLGSRKGDELAANPHAALVFYWQPLDRQVRVEGTVERVAGEEAQAYFDTRPHGSRIAAWASPQSRPVASRDELERLYAQAEKELAGAAGPRLPPHWGGYRVRPGAFEFWHSRANRLHDRIRYERDGDGWTQVRLAP